jgi:hypothetical protein
MQLTDRAPNVRDVSAPECVRLAQLTDDPVLRLHLLNMARDWMAAVTKEMDDSVALLERHL